MKLGWFRLTQAVWFSQLVYVVLGLLLITAATSKAVFLRDRVTVGAESLFRSPLILAAVVFAEMVVGIWFLVLPRLFPRLTRAFGIGFFAILGCFSGYAVMTGRQCNCFGTSHVPGLAAFGVDLVAVILLVSLSVAERPDRGRCFRLYWRLSAVGAGVLLCALPVSIWASRYSPSQVSDLGIVVGDSRLVVLQPIEWKGKPFPLQPYAALPPTIMHGEWLIVIHSRECSRCQKLLRRLVLIASKDPNAGSRPLALIDTLPCTISEPNSRASGRIVSACLTQEWHWIARVPNALLIRDGIVVGVCEDANQIFAFALRALLGAAPTFPEPLQPFGTGRIRLSRHDDLHLTPLS